MTDPLIDQHALLVEIAEEFVRDGGVWMTPDSVLDAVIGYLRSVLTPEALETTEVFRDADGCRRIRVLTRDDMYRRIFGRTDD